MIDPAAELHTGAATHQQRVPLCRHMLCLAGRNEGALFWCAIHG